jgi:hypothetical protein
VAHRDDAAFVAGGALVAHVDFRRLIRADQDHGQPWPPLSARREPVRGLANLAPQALGDGFSVDDACRHVVLPGKGAAFCHGGTGHSRFRSVTSLSGAAGDP